MTFSGTCVCGRPADSFGGLCDRCVALQTMGLPPTATDAEVEDTYQTLVKVWQPDRFQTDPQTQRTAEEKLKEINAAHLFLFSESATQQPPRDDSGDKRPQPPRPPEDRFRAPLADTPPVAPKSRESESEEVRRILRRQRRISFPKLLVKLGFALGVIFALAVLWLVIDSILSANRKTAGDWDQYKAEVARDIRATFARLSGTTGDLPGGKDQTSTSAGETASPQLSPAPYAMPPNRAPSHPTPGKVSGKTLQPYVTSGLTPTEVLAILGKPTSSSGERMLYNGSEIDFKDGHVVGWKIDSASPIRVKLWPDTAPTPGIAHFAIGSSKSDVIALQGTPTFFSENKFAYGNSIVLFQNNRVVGWKEDPASVHLRVAP